MKKKMKKKKVKESKETKGEARGESTQVSLFWFALWVNYQNFNVITKAAMNLIPFSCMLRTFYNDEDVVLPASLLSHCGRVISRIAQMIQDLSTIKTPCTTLPHQTNAPSKLNPKIPQQRNGNKTGFGCSFLLVTSSDRRNRRCPGLHKKGIWAGKCIRNFDLSF